MKMGFITAILEDYSFEEVIDFASAHGFSCVELACWPSGKAERRYAGVSHLDVDVLDEAKVHYVQEYCKSAAWRFRPWRFIRTLWTRIWKSARPTSST